ncbi:hypothetical protein IBT49_03420 [Erwinia sp. S63]|uniref:hypothetical protein n=1 Tax=Erwiniaceae TaxID=1903409 RepID=UPI00190C81E7|nr:hypothetical protein [Erwinia sp. S63]MBK0095012.1 hypothetical protein [Erwinia sp. S63]
MNDKLIEFIDERLKNPEPEPLDQLVYILAKLSLISSPVAWMVKFKSGKGNIPCLTRQHALEMLNEFGDADSYIVPLFTVLKADIVPLNNVPTLRLTMRTIKKH